MQRIERIRYDHLVRMGQKQKERGMVVIEVSRGGERERGSRNAREVISIKESKTQELDVKHVA